MTDERTVNLRGPSFRGRWVVLFDVQGRLSALENEEGDIRVFGYRIDAERAVEGHILEDLHQVVQI